MNTPNERETGAPVETAEQARQAVPLGSVRYVLAISIGLAVLAGLIIWFGFFA